MSSVYPHPIPDNWALREFGRPTKTGLEVFGAMAGMDTLGPLANRAADISAAEEDIGGIPFEGGELPGQGPLVPLKDAPRLEPDELNKRYKRYGLVFDKPVTEETARIMADAKRAEMIRNDIVARGPGGLAGASAALAGGLVATAIDPLEIGSALIPIVSQARTAGLIARFGAVRGRAIVGVTEGAVGNALVEPIYAGLSYQQQLDYGMSDALINVGLGGVLGGVLGAGAGAVSRSIQFEGARVRKPNMPPLIAALPEESRVSALRASVAQLAQGKTVDITALIRVVDDLHDLPLLRLTDREEGDLAAILVDMSPRDLDALSRAVRRRRVTKSLERINAASSKQLDDLAEMLYEMPVEDIRQVHRELRDTRVAKRLEGISGLSERGLDILARDLVDMTPDEIRSVHRLLKERRFVSEAREIAKQLKEVIPGASPEAVERLEKMFGRMEPQDFDVINRMVRGRTATPVDPKARVLEAVAGRFEDWVGVAAREQMPQRDFSADFDAFKRIQREAGESFDLDAEGDVLQEQVRLLRDQGALDEASQAEVDALASIDRHVTTYSDTARAAAACMAR